MLYSGKKLRASSDKINKYSNSCNVRKKNSERNKKLQRWGRRYRSFYTIMQTTR